MLKLLALVIPIGLLAGCASEPEWVSGPPKALCFNDVDKACLADLVAASIQRQPPGRVRDRTLLYASSLATGIGIDEPAGLKEMRERAEQVMCLAPNASYAAAGKAIAEARAGKYDSAINLAVQFEDTQAQMFAFRHIAVLAARSKDIKSAGRALSILANQDRPGYMEALQERLVALLHAGDLERAAALRSELLAYYAQRPGNSASVARVAITYATAGHLEDARAFLEQASEHVPGLKTQDMASLFDVVFEAAKGRYPAPQDFFAFSSDVMRLEAYVQLATLYDRSGQDLMSRRISADMARFAQKSTFHVDGEAATTAFTKVLIETR